MIPTGGIGQQLDQLKGLSIQELMQRQSVDPQLVYALALQEKQKMEAAKERQAAMGMQAPQGTEVEKMEADLASRRAPGVQQMAQRSMRAAQPQMARGIASVPSPNMGAVGRAQGGIVGYLEGGGVEGDKAQAPATGSENQRRAPYLDPALEKFLVDLETLNAQKDAAAPQEKDLFEQKIQDLLNTASPKVKRMASESTFGLPKKSGMAMGGEVKGFAGLDGSLVSSPGYPRPYQGEDGKYYVNGQELTGGKNEADAITAFIDQKEAEQAARDRARNNPPVERPFNPDVYYRTDNVMRRQRAAEDRAEELRREQEREERRARQARERDEAKRAVGEGIAQLKDVGRSAINTPLNFLGDFITDFPKNYGDLTQDTVQLAQAVRGRLEEEAEKRRKRQEEERKFQEEQATADALGMRPPTKEQAAKELFAPVFEAREAAGQKPAGIATVGAGQGQTTAQTPGAGQPQATTPPAEEGGIRSALGKAKPVADKIAGVLEVLGRGAGASKGFEGARIVEESRKIREAEADRAARLAEQRALLSARKEELDARNAMAMGMSVADYAAGLTDDAIMMSDEFTALEERLKDEAGFFMNDEEEESINRKLAEAVKTIRQKKLQDYKDIMAQYSGVGGQTGVSTTKAPISYADYNPTT
jgi:hypothetical protein